MKINCCPGLYILTLCLIIGTQFLVQAAPGVSITFADLLTSEQQPDDQIHLKPEKQKSPTQDRLIGDLEHAIETVQPLFRPLRLPGGFCGCPGGRLWPGGSRADPPDGCLLHRRPRRSQSYHGFTLGLYCGGLGEQLRIPSRGQGRPPPAL